MSTEATLASKGQTTIPKAIRDSLGLMYKRGRKRVPTDLLSR